MEHRSATKCYKRTVQSNICFCRKTDDSKVSGYIYDKRIKQSRLFSYPVIETCYDAAKHEEVLRENDVLFL